MQSTAESETFVPVNIREIEYMGQWADFLEHPILDSEETVGMSTKVIKNLISDLRSVAIYRAVVVEERRRQQQAFDERRQRQQALDEQERIPSVFRVFRYLLVRVFTFKWRSRRAR